LVDRALLDGAEPDVSAIANKAGINADEVAEIVETRRLLFAEGLIGPSSSVDAEAAELEVPASDDPTPPPFARWIEDRIGAAPVGSKRPERVGRWTLDGIGIDHPLGRWFPAFESDGVLAADVLVLRARMPSDVVDRVFHAARLARGLDGDTWIGVHETGFEDDLAYVAFEPFGATLADVGERDCDVRRFGNTVDGGRGQWPSGFRRSVFRTPHVVPRRRRSRSRTPPMSNRSVRSVPHGRRAFPRRIVATCFRSTRPRPPSASTGAAM
jgi:plasmid stabilization system protein ParE